MTRPGRIVSNFRSKFSEFDTNSLNRSWTLFQVFMKKFVFLQIVGCSDLNGTNRRLFFNGP